VCDLDQTLVHACVDPTIEAWLGDDEAGKVCYRALSRRRWNVGALTAGVDPRLGRRCGRRSKCTGCACRTRRASSTTCGQGKARPAACVSLPCAPADGAAAQPNGLPTPAAGLASKSFWNMRPSGTSFMSTRWALTITRSRSLGSSTPRAPFSAIASSRATRRKARPSSDMTWGPARTAC